MSSKQHVSCSYASSSKESLARRSKPQHGDISSQKRCGEQSHHKEREEQCPEAKHRDLWSSVTSNLACTLGKKDLNQIHLKRSNVVYVCSQPASAENSCHVHLFVSHGMDDSISWPATLDRASTSTLLNDYHSTRNDYSYSFVLEMTNICNSNLLFADIVCGLNCLRITDFVFLSSDI